MLDSEYGEYGTSTRRVVATMTKRDSNAMTVFRVMRIDWVNPDASGTAWDYSPLFALGLAE